MIRARLGGRPIGPSHIVLAVGVAAFLAAAVDILLTLDRLPHQMRGVLGVFLLMMVLGAFLQVRTPAGLWSSPVALAIGLGLAFGSRMSPVGPLMYRAAGVVVIAAIALMIGAFLLRVFNRERERLPMVSARVVAIAVAALLYRTVPVLGGQTALQRFPEWSASRWRMTLVMFVIGGIAAVVDLVLATWTIDRVRPYWPTLLEDARELAPISLAAVSTGVAIALGLQPLGVLSVVLMVCPLVLLRFTIVQQTDLRHTRRQTIAALSRLTDVAGYTPDGHAIRVARLSVRVGRRLALSDRDLAVLEDAALLHDIGQVRLSEPIPGGATVEAAPMDQAGIAHESAKIVRRTRALDEVIVVLEDQATQYREVRELGHDVPLASRIIKVCNAYEDFTRGDPGRRDAAIERLYLGLGYEYDPEIIEALVAAVGHPSG